MLTNSPIKRRRTREDCYLPLEEVVESIDNVTGEDILRLASKIFSRQELTIAGLGPLEKVEIDWKS